MRGTLSKLSLAGLLAMTVSAAAQSQGPSEFLGVERYWGIYAFSDPSQGQHCFVGTIPLTQAPTSLSHGDVFFFVNHRRDQDNRLEPQFLAGYQLQNDSKVTVTVGERSFTMFTNGGNSGWLEERQEEMDLLSAMRAGSDMVVQATSAKGNNTTYKFSLMGLTAALSKAGSCQ